MFQTIEHRAAAAGPARRRVPSRRSARAALCQGPPAWRRGLGGHLGVPTPASPSRPPPGAVPRAAAPPHAGWCPSILRFVRSLDGCAVRQKRFGKGRERERNVSRAVEKSDFRHLNLCCSRMDFIPA